MDPTDKFFTQTIVGAPFTVLLGRRQSLGNTDFQGLEINPSTGERGFSRVWHEWIVLSHDHDAPGKPRRRPGKLRRWLERHALWVAVLGLLALSSAGAFWGFQQWR